MPESCPAGGIVENSAAVRLRCAGLLLPELFRLFSSSHDDHARHVTYLVLSIRHLRVSAALHIRIVRQAAARRRGGCAHGELLPRLLRSIPARFHRRPERCDGPDLPPLPRERPGTDLLDLRRLRRDRLHLAILAAPGLRGNIPNVLLQNHGTAYGRPP